MKPRKKSLVQSQRFPVLTLFIFGLISGCSDSSELVTDGMQDSIDTTSIEPNNTNAVSVNLDVTNAEPDNTITSDEVNSSGTNDNNLNFNETGSESEVESGSSGEILDGSLEVTVNSDSSLPDPLNPTTTIIQFDITVPEYQSNELRVELTWNDTTLTAMWIGDEYWSVSGDFPTETEHLLTITFYDFNGDIELARYTELYKTGSNAMESLQVSANQFDADQFDSDRDGTSNLTELIAGTSPVVDEDSLLDIIDIYALSTHPRMSVSRNVESLLTNERPYVHSSETSPVGGATFYEDVDVDAKGNGTLSHSRFRGSTQLKIKGIRTSTDNLIRWEGSRETYDGDYWHKGTFTSAVGIVNENTRTLTEYYEGNNSGTFVYQWEINSHLTGRLIEGTSLCKPIAGSVSITDSRNPNAFISTTTINKEMDDSYWRVINVHEDLVNDTSETSEYFVVDLLIYKSRNPDGITGDDETPDDPYFICDFIDF